MSVYIVVLLNFDALVMDVGEYLRRKSNSFFEVYCEDIICL